MTPCCVAKVPMQKSRGINPRAMDWITSGLGSSSERLGKCDAPDQRRKLALHSAMEYNPMKFDSGKCILREIGMPVSKYSSQITRRMKRMLSCSRHCCVPSIVHVLYIQRILLTHGLSYTLEVRSHDQLCISFNVGGSDLWSDLWTPCNGGGQATSIVVIIMIIIQVPNLRPFARSCNINHLATVCLHPLYSSWSIYGILLSKVKRDTWIKPFSVKTNMPSTMVNTLFFSAPVL